LASFEGLSERQHAVDRGARGLDEGRIHSPDGEGNGSWNLAGYEHLNLIIALAHQAPQPPDELQCCVRVTCSLPALPAHEVDHLLARALRACFTLRIVFLTNACPPSLPAAGLSTTLLVCVTVPAALATLMPTPPPRSEVVWHLVRTAGYTSRTRCYLFITACNCFELHRVRLQP